MVIKDKVILKKFNWTKDKSVFVTGFSWVDGKYLSEQKFAEFIAGKAFSFENFSQTIQLLNGQFSIIAEHEDEIWMAACHTWSYPLYYTTTSKGIIISDKPNELLIEKQITGFEPFSEIYFLTFGVTPLANTLIEGVFQIQPGEIIRVRKQNIETSTYLPFSGKSNLNSDHVTEKELYEFLLFVFEKYFNKIKNQQVLLPLTRGYDSRLLASLLKEYGHENVICATWGRSSGSEIGTAKKVAWQLGYKHFFVDTSKIVNGNFVRSPEFNSYIDYTGHWSSMPFLYEYFGVNELINRQIIDDSTIALPGHPGDFVRGEHFSWDIIDSSPDYLASKIISKFGTSYLLKSEEKEAIRKYIASKFFNDNNQSLKQGYELWDFKERQCKFIGNSSQVYPYFGLERLMPLFDLEVINFFRKVSDKQKVDQRLYFSTLEKYFFKKFKIDFDLKSPESKRKNNSFKEGVLKALPHSIKQLYYPLNDDNCYREITHELRNANKEFHFKYPFRPNAYNSYIIQWYLFSLQKLFGTMK